jgi:hypothetical protein
MVEVPFPTMVTVDPSIVATASLELVYVINPLLLDVGTTKLKDASPTIFAGTEKLVIVGVAWFTVKVAGIEPDR